MEQTNNVDVAIKQIAAEFQNEITLLEKKKRVEGLARIKAATPVDTGAARDSWQIKRDKIVSDSDYMIDLNHGTSQQAPTHFIEKTLLTDPQLTPNGTIVLIV